MRKLILVALSIALLFGAIALGTHGADAAPTMHNCPQDGKWAISVWTGDEADAGEALGTCGNITVAYSLTPAGAWERYIPGAPEVNNMGPLQKYDGVIALGGPAVPVAEPETNVSLFGTLDGCTADLLTVSAHSAGDSSRTSWVSRLHDEPFTTIEQTDEGTLYSWTFQQTPIIKTLILLCDDEVLVDADVPKASGDAHIYTISVLITGNTYEILPRGHEYMYFDCGKRPDGTIFMCRGMGDKIPFNPTCPNDAWTWDERDPRGFWCEGYPDAVFLAHECGPGQEPVPGTTYCVR